MSKNVNQYRKWCGSAAGPWYTISEGFPTVNMVGYDRIEFRVQPLLCGELSPFTIDGSKLKCELEAHSNVGKHLHNFDMSEINIEDYDCSHYFEW